MSTESRITPVDGRPICVLPIVRPVGALRPWIFGVVYLMALFPMTGKFRHSGNVMSRYLQIEAIVEQGSLIVDKTPLFRLTRPVDLVRFRDHFYSDKPPVLAVLASPFYAAFVLMGTRMTSSERDFIAINLGVTWALVGTCSGLTLVWLRKLFQTIPIAPLAADALTLALGFGSQLLTYGVTLNNHSVAAAFITGAWAVTSLERPGPRKGFDRFWAGFLAGLAATIDLPAGCLMLASLGLIQAVRARSMPWAFALGSGGPLLLHCWLQSRVTGTPLPVEMYPESFNYLGSFWLTPDGTFHEYGPRIGFGMELLVGPPGWLTITPVLAFGLVGLALVLRRLGDPLRPMAVAVAISVVVLWAYYTWGVRRTDFGGQSFGTRHLLAITPAVYFFAVVAWSRLRGVFARSLFVALFGFGTFYAWYGMINPWVRVEELAQTDPVVRQAQRFVLYPWSRTRHKLEVEQQAAQSAPKVRP